MPVGGMRQGWSAGAGADLVVRNAKIHTGDPARPAASAVAITDGVFTAVGDDADRRPAHRPRHSRRGRAGSPGDPGLNDSHPARHPGAGPELSPRAALGRGTVPPALWPCSGSRPACTPRTGSGSGWLEGWTRRAVRRAPHADRSPELNAAAPDTPVFVLHLYQSALINRAAVAGRRVSPGTRRSLRGGQIVRDREGEPTGVSPRRARARPILYSTLAQGPGSSPPSRQIGIDPALPAGAAQPLRPDLRDRRRRRLPELPRQLRRPSRACERGELTLRIAYHLFPQTAGQELADLTPLDRDGQPRRRRRVAPG